MNDDFRSYLAARQDYSAYLSAKGYQVEDSGYAWYAGLDELEDEPTPQSLGAMSLQVYNNNYYVLENNKM